MIRTFQLEQEVASTAFPLVGSRVQAGFPSPADDFLEDRLDLNQLLVKHPAATFFVRVEGDSMINAGIYHNDILIVDKALQPENGYIVIAIYDGELTVKRLRYSETALELCSENPKYPNIQIPEGSDFRVWGVVTSVIHSLCPEQPLV